MFIPIAFMCFVNTECVWVNNIQPVTLEECQLAGDQLKKTFIDSEKVVLVRTDCLPVETDS